MLTFIALKLKNLIFPIEPCCMFLSLTLDIIILLVSNFFFLIKRSSKHQFLAPLLCVQNLSIWSDRRESPGNCSPQLQMQSPFFFQVKNTSSFSINLYRSGRCLKTHILIFNVAMIFSHVCFINHHSQYNKIICLMCTQDYLFIYLPNYAFLLIYPSYYVSRK